MTDQPPTSPEFEALVNLLQDRYAAGEVEYLTFEDRLVAAVPIEQADAWEEVITRSIARRTVMRRLWGETGE